LISTAEQFGKVMRSSFNAIHNAFHCVGRRMASHRRDEHGRNFEMSEKFKEPKAPRFAMWPLITAGFACAVALGLFAITPAGGLFAPDRLDGTSARKLKQEISYCRMPEVSPHRLGRILSGRAKPVAGSDARKAT
jgi:hypothetical protein